MRFEGARLTLRLNRFELIAFGLALGGLAVVMFVASTYVAGLTPAVACRQPGEVVPPDCEAAQRAFGEAQQLVNGLLVAPLLLVTYAIGLFLGVPIIGRELERGTVRLAWWLAPSRWRWYVARVGPILLILIVLTFAAGVAMDRFLQVSTPDQDISRSFDGYGVRGGLLASRALFIFAISVVAGSIIGRALPAMIIAALVVAIGLTGGTNVHERILATEAVVVPVDINEFGGSAPGDKFIDQKFVLPDGTLVGYDYFGNEPPFDEFGNPSYPMVSLLIPGERYRFVEAREALALAGGSLVALLLAGFVVSRRRPG